jgi:casein kinase II subunit beta
VDELSTGSESDYANSWVTWFLSTKGNEYFCEVDEEYILDRFNLTGLNSEVHRYGMALDLITDAFGEFISILYISRLLKLDSILVLFCKGVDELDEASRESVEGAARHLYGLIHARYIITSRGLAKMVSTLSLSF